jgi:hypothetical protein
VTSLEALTGRPLPMAEVQTAVAQAFAAVFDREIVESALEPSGAIG